MAGLQMPMRKVLVLANQLWTKNGKELVITAALDGTHSAGSFHYYGFALDFRTRYFSKAVARKIAKKLQRLLGDDYVVVVESTHMHVQFNEGK